MWPRCRWPVASPDDNTVLNFRVASTERRYDNRMEAWIDRAPLFISVSCWRQLAENVHASLFLGDPVIVRGRLKITDYEQDGQSRTDVKVEAVAIGPDLSRSRATVTRVRREAAEAGPAVDGVDAGADVGARPVPGADRAPVGGGRAVAGGVRAVGPGVDPSSDDQPELLGAQVEAGVGA
jgi:single-strand DNA-binding protein